MLVGYVSIEDANEYIQTHYTSNDPSRISWESLTDDDKQVILLRAFESIESLPFRGCKSVPGQDTAFPRFPDKEVPNIVKYAQIEQAVSTSDSANADEEVFYDKLWRYGVESYSIGNLSERSSSGEWGRGVNSNYGSVSRRAAKLLNPYLSGGFSVHPMRCCK